MHLKPYIVRKADTYVPCQVVPEKKDQYITPVVVKRSPILGIQYHALPVDFSVLIKSTLGVLDIASRLRNR